MKLFVGLFEEDYEGLPLTELESTSIEVGETASDLYSGVVNALLPMLESTGDDEVSGELATLLQQYGVSSPLQLAEVNTYLVPKGYRVVVGIDVSEVSVAELNEGENIIMSLVPSTYAGLPVVNRTIIDPEQFSFTGITSEIIAKFNIGSGIVPVNNLVNIVSSMEELSSRGLPVTDTYQTTVMNELAKYGITTYYVYPKEY